MITDLEIIKAVKAGIKGINSDIPIYLDEQKEGFDTPTVFLKADTLRIPETKYRFSVDTTIYISYIPKQNGNPADTYKFKDQLFSLYWRGIRVNKNTYIHTDSINFNIGDTENDVLLVTLRLKYIDGIERQESKYKMDDLNMNLSDDKYKITK